MAGPTKGKQATKGQKQIFNENKETIAFYRYLSLGFTGLYVGVMLLGTMTGFFANDSIFDYKYLIYIVFTILVNFGVLKTFTSMAAAKMDGNSIVDGGLDLNMEGGMAEYFKDLIILNAAVQTLSLYSNYFWWLWATVPAMAAYKVTTGIILPWIFAPPPEVDEEQNEKKQRKMDRRMRRAG